MIKKTIIFILTLLFLEAIVYFQESTAAILIIVILLIALSLLSTIKLKVLHQTGFLGQLNITVLPAIYLISIITFLVFIPSSFFLQHIYIVTASILFVFTINCAENVIKDLKNRKSLAANDFLIIISAFLLYSSILGLSLFLIWPIWLIMLLLIIATFILTYEFFWYNQLFEKHIIYTLILTLIISELGWALSLWPTGFISRAIIIFVIFYIFTNLSKHHFNKTLNNKIIRNSIIISLIVVLLVLLTSKWTF